MKLGRRAEFFLIGVAVVPAVLLFAGFPDLALFNLIPLAFATCLSGVVDHMSDDKDDRLNIDD
jgi:hypothetical protein